MKSLAVGVFWPAWEWTTMPHRRWLFASYALSLSERDSVKCRRLIESRWYQSHWGDRFALRADQNTKLRFENDATGHRIATSVGGAATGEGGDRVVVDDPHNVTERESEAARVEALQWWDQTMSTRLNNPKVGSKVIVMQRVHAKDLSGHVLEQGGYVHLCLPAEFEPGRRCVTAIDWKDPRRHDGELLWPARVGAKEIAEFKMRLGPEGYAGQFQQRPRLPAGDDSGRNGFAITVVPAWAWCRWEGMHKTRRKFVSILNRLVRGILVVGQTFLSVLSRGVRGILAPPSRFEWVREDRNVLHSPIRDRQECLPCRRPTRRLNDFRIVKKRNRHWP